MRLILCRWVTYINARLPVFTHCDRFSHAWLVITHDHVHVAVVVADYFSIIGLLIISYRKNTKTETYTFSGLGGSHKSWLHITQYRTESGIPLPVLLGYLQAYTWPSHAYPFRSWRNLELLSASFEYPFYGCTAIRNICIPSVPWSSSYVRIWRLQTSDSDV